MRSIFRDNVKHSPKSANEGHSFPILKYYKMFILNLKIGQRLALGFAVVTLLAALMGALAYLSLSRTGAEWQQFETQALQKNNLGVEGKLKLGDAVVS